MDGASSKLNIPGLILAACRGGWPATLQETLETQLKTFGFIFEQMCIRDLKAYTADFNSHLSYYRDRYGLEADWVLHLEDGRYDLIEGELGSRKIDDVKHVCF